MKPQLQPGLVVFLALTAVAVGNLAWQQHRELVALRDAATTSRAERIALEQRLRETERRAQELKSELAAAQVKTADLAPFGDEGAVPSSDEAATSQPRRGPGGGRRNAMFEDPELVALWTSQQKSALDHRYAPLFKTLAQAGMLTPEQLDAFKSLLVEKQSAVRDAFTAARTNGLTDRSEIDRIAREAQAEIDQQIQSTLGDAAYNQYMAYEATLPQRTVLNQIAQRLSYSAAPLNDAQSQQLLRILAETATTDSRGHTTLTADTLTRAQGVLAPDQLQALADLQKLQSDQQLMREKMRDFRRGSEGPPTAK